VLSLVALSQSIGEERMWNIVDGHLNASQEKLLAVYIERVRRREVE
jgi:hypothetical protein